MGKKKEEKKKKKKKETCYRMYCYFLLDIALPHNA